VVGWGDVTVVLSAVVEGVLGPWAFL